MTIFICATCGTSYPDAANPPASCPICTEERQYVPLTGQRWTTQASLQIAHVNAWRRHEPGLYSLHTQPAFAISQRAFLLCTPEGNVLWDCLSLLDPATEDLIDSLGGLRAIAISHPHYYSCMQDWARRFGCPVYLHADDRAWIMRPDDAVKNFSDETIELLPGVTVIRLGGHFAGGTVLHWAHGDGVILSGDIVQVAADTSRVSFLWSYPNMMPLPARTVRHIAATLAPLAFDRMYGAFVGKDILRDAHGVVARSAARYVELIEG